MIRRTRNDIARQLGVGIERNPPVARSLLFTVVPLAMTLLVMVLTACSSRDARTEGKWKAQRTVEGAVTVVRTISGSVWQDRAELVEELTIGQREGDARYVLGNVQSLWSQGDRIYILDRAIPALRVYSGSGRHLLDVGREGDGPGEFREPMSIAVHPIDGRIFVRDGSVGRLNVYSPNGEPLERWPIRGSFGTGRQMIMTTEGYLYTLILIRFDADPLEWQYGLARCAPAGTVQDTIPVPIFNFEPWRLTASSEGRSGWIPVPFSPQVVYAFTPERRMVAGISDRYRFDIHHPDGTILRIEKPNSRVPIQPEEAAWYERWATASRSRVQPGWVWNGPPIPPHKPAFEAFFPDPSGRIWVLRPGPGQIQENGVEDATDPSVLWNNPRWRDQYFFDVFDPEGAFLGSLQIPPGSQFFPPPFISEESLLVYTEDESGTPIVKRYRLVLH